MDTTSWQGPPADVLGHVVPVQRVVARTRHAVIALQHLVAFPEGCTLELQLAVRRGSLDDSTWRAVVAGHLGADPGPAEGEAGLKLGVRFPDGAKATTVDHAFRGWAHPTDRPERPLLVDAGSDASSDDQEYRSRQRLWLWPLPPPLPFELVVAWEDMGLPLTSTVLDGSAVVDAAQHTEPLWT